MDVAEQVARTNQVKDQIGERCQKLFQDFLEEYVSSFSPEINLRSKSQRHSSVHGSGSER